MRIYYINNQTYQEMTQFELRFLKKIFTDTINFNIKD